MKEMNRREFLTLSGAAVVALSLAGCGYVFGSAIPFTLEPLWRSRWQAAAAGPPRP